jgi:hypothetical protein
MDVAAFIVALFAAAFTGWAAWHARGQKLAADRAVAEAKRASDAAERAASAAEGALGIERQREFERGRPDVEVWFDGSLSSARLTLENTGARPIDSARVELVSADSALVGFAEDETKPRQPAHEFGRLNAGELVMVEFITVEQDRELIEPTVKFLATFRIGDDEWNKLYSVELPPPAFDPF